MPKSQIRVSILCYQILSFQFPQDAYIGPLNSTTGKHKTLMHSTMNVFESQTCIHFVVSLVFKNILCVIRQSTIQVFMAKTLMVILFATISHGISIVKHILVTF